MTKLVIALIPCFVLAAAEAKRGGFSFDFGGTNKQPDILREWTCPPGQTLINKPEGMRCMRDFSQFWQQDGFTQLPAVGSVLDSAEERCFSQKKIHWYPDGTCYPLLTRGPCKPGEWLVVVEKKSARTRNLRVTCQVKECPCLEHDPDFCEVQMPKSSVSSGCNRCRVALAAEQQGICGPGQQLVNSPFGLGVCSCRIKPRIHVQWPQDQRCYPLYEHGGPCTINETLHWSSKADQPLCVPNICPAGQVLFPDDGRCYVMHTQGPCSAMEDELTLDLFTRELVCRPRHEHKGKVKRIFDVLPSGLRRSADGHILAADLESCISPDGTAICNPATGRLMITNDPRLGQKRATSGTEKARKFLKWIYSFHA